MAGRIAATFVFFALAGCGVVMSARQESSRVQAERVNWVGSELKRMETIHVGMTRSQLLEIFTPVGGIQDDTRATFNSRACLYFKVDVVFKHVRGKEDTIASISRPYLSESLIHD
jgi:hypothetical protein